MSISGFIKFVNGLLENRRPLVRALGKLVCNDVRSLTGRNFNTIQVETKLQIKPGVSKHTELLAWMVYDPPDGQEWKLPLLSSLLAIRDSEWGIIFNDETEGLDNNFIQVLIDNICVRN